MLPGSFLAWFSPQIIPFFLCKGSDKVTMVSPRVIKRNFTGEGIRSEKLLKHTDDNFLIEVLRELTKKGVLLDLLRNRGLGGDMTTGGCLGNSNQEMLEFKLFGDREEACQQSCYLGPGD